LLVEGEEIVALLLVVDGCHLLQGLG
jgi:hypothetical protein